jgi:hypothetical protein
MSKYKVGDKIRIKSLEEFKKCVYINPEGEMNRWAGTVMTILRVSGGGGCEYVMSEDQETREQGPHHWWWHNDMIEGLYVESIQKDTNRTRFLAMTNKQLVEVLNCSCCIYYQKKSCPEKFNKPTCEKGTIAWLEEEIEDAKV